MRQAQHGLILAIKRGEERRAGNESESVLRASSERASACLKVTPLETRARWTGEERAGDKGVRFPIVRARKAVGERESERKKR